MIARKDELNAGKLKKCRLKGTMLKICHSLTIKKQNYIYIKMALV